MTLLDSPTTVTPVFDQATNVVLGNIYNYLKSQQGDTDTREIIERLERINNSTITESRTRGVNDRATQAALRGIEDIQRRNGDLSGNNDRATQAALKGIIGNQKKDASTQAKDRATQKALFGNIDKNTRNMTNSLGKFKDAMNNAFSNLKSFLTPFLDKSLKSFTDLSKTMRKANLTRAQKDQIQGMASSAIGDVEKMFDGLQVSRDEINDFMGDLIASGKDLNDMSAEQRASYIALRKRGVADEQAFNQAMTASSNQIKGTVLAMGDPAIAQTLKKATSNITSAMSVSAGGTDKALAQMTENVRGIEAELGNALNPETASKLATVMFKVKNGMIDQMSEEEIMLNTVIHGATDAKSAAEALKKADTATLARMGIVEDNLANIQNFQNSGTKTGKTVRPDEQNKVANSQNTTNGKVQQTFDKLLASLDKSTGGLVGKTANILDEYLGDSADIGTLVKNGFKLVTMSLKTIAFNTGFFGKALMGLGGAAAIVALIANWDKIKPKLAEMFPKIKEALSSALKNIGPFFKNLWSGFKQNIGPFVKDIVSGLKSLLPGFGSGVKSALSGVFGKESLADPKALGASVSSAMSDIDFGGIGSSIGGALKDIVGGIGDLLGGSSPFFKGILDGIATILSSFMPELSTIVHDIVECIDRLIDAIAPHIPQIISAVQSVIDIVSKAVDYIAPYIPEIVAAVRDIAIALVEIVPPIVECIRDIGVSFIEGTRDVINNAVTTIGDIINNTVSVIGDVLIAISPAINFIGEAIDVIAKSLAPLLPKIVDTIDYGIRTLLPPLVNKIVPELLALFKKILPPILDIIKKAVEIILPPVLEILKIIAENIMPPIQHALDVVIGLIDRIANFLLDVLERIFNLIMNVLEPILTAISELLTSIIELATTIVDTVKEVVLFIKDVVQVAHGLFNFFTSKIPDLIGWVSGVFNFLSNDIAPIVRSGFKLIYNVIDALYKGLKAIIITAIWPIKKIVDAIDYLFKKLYYFLKTAPYIGDKDDGSNPELVKLRHEVEESKLVLTGHDASEKTEELKKVYEAALQKSGGEYTNEVWTAWKEYKASLEKDGSLRERANEDAVNAFKEVAAEAENFSNNVKKAIDNGGPKKDEAVVEEVQQYLSGQKGNITNENILPSNTGSLLESITKYTESTLGTLNSIFGLLKSFNSTKLGGGGGPFTSATPATLGEDGKEIALPLTKPKRVEQIMSSLTSDERSMISSAAEPNMSKVSSGPDYSKYVSSYNNLNFKPDFAGWPDNPAPGDERETIEKILSMASPEEREYIYESLSYGRNKDGTLKSKKPGSGPKQRVKWVQEAIANAADNSGRELIKGTFAEKALDWAATQLGKPYILESLGKIGYVCNELTRAAMKNSGFDMKNFQIHSVKQTFKNLTNGKYTTHVDKKTGKTLEYPDFRVREDLTPETALPGMVFFQDGRTNKDGGFQPGHIGLVYYGHKLIHASGGSGDYTKPGFMYKWQTPGRGVTVTPPKDGGSYVIGEFPGMFERSDGTMVDTSSAATAAKTQSSDGNLSAQNNFGLTEDNVSYLDNFLKNRLNPNADTPLTEEEMKALDSYQADLVASGMDYETVKKIFSDKDTINMLRSNNMLSLSKTADEAVATGMRAGLKQLFGSFDDQAKQSLASGGSASSIAESLGIIVRYLRDISLNSKQKKPIATAPTRTAYGT